MEQANQPQFQIQKVYTKDLSFNIPNPTEIWTAQWAPQLKTDINITVSDLPEENTYETVLTLTVSVKNNDMDAFDAEVKQAGIFSVQNMQDDHLNHAKKAFCPNILYHFARETIADLVSNGGFPQLNLSAVNFDKMYQESTNPSKEDNTH